MTDNLDDALAAKDAEIAKWRERAEFYADKYAEVQVVLDIAHGPNQEDGAGEGIVADVELLRRQRDEYKEGQQRALREREALEAATDEKLVAAWRERDQAREELALAQGSAADRAGIVMRTGRELDQLRAELDALILDRDEAVATILLAMQHVAFGSRAWVILDDYDGSRDNIAEVDARMADGRMNKGTWRYADSKALKAKAAAVDATGSYPNERRCQRCHGPNLPWSAPSPLWNQVMRGGDVNGVEIHAGIICPTCFAVLAETAGVADLWRLHAERVHVPLQTVTPSGRVWNPQRWMWEEPGAPASRNATDDEVRAVLHGGAFLDGVIYPELTETQRMDLLVGDTRRAADDALAVIDETLRANTTEPVAGNGPDECSCAQPCCELDTGVGFMTCGSQHCAVHGLWGAEPASTESREHQ